MKITAAPIPINFDREIYIQRSVEEGGDGGGGEFIVASRNGTVRAISSIGADVTVSCKSGGP